jgi:hypothetical protein
MCGKHGWENQRISVSLPILNNKVASIRTHLASFINPKHNQTFRGDDSEEAGEDCPIQVPIAALNAAKHTKRGYGLTRVYERG